MRKISTSLKAPRLLRKLCLSVLLIPITLLAQTTHTVNVGPGLVYEPAELTITAGDIVTWISLGGYHDVNFDENSVNGNSFGNPISIAEASLPPQGEGTMGSITFPEAGTYDYDCSVGSHALGGMVGKVIVNAAPSSTLSAADEILELFEPWNSAITLANGWNMFGYGCPEPDDVAEVLSAHTDKIIIVKNNSGDAYLTEYSFNGIGDFLPGQGYQIKLIETIEGFSFCDAYIEDIPAKLNEILNAD